jgi:hypothetical protein
MPESQELVQRDVCPNDEVIARLTALFHNFTVSASNDLLFPHGEKEIGFGS